MANRFSTNILEENMSNFIGLVKNNFVLYFEYIFEPIGRKLLGIRIRILFNKYIQNTYLNNLKSI